MLLKTRYFTRYKINVNSSIILFLNQIEAKNFHILITYYFKLRKKLLKKKGKKQIWWHFEVQNASFNVVDFLLVNNLRGKGSQTLKWPPRPSGVRWKLVRVKIWEMWGRREEGRGGVEVMKRGGIDSFCNQFQ